VKKHAMQIAEVCNGQPASHFYFVYSFLCRLECDFQPCSSGMPQPILIKHET